MSLTQALATSLSGLNATQTNLSIVAGNVANAQTPGYIAQSAVQVATTSGDAGDSVRIASINRLLDQFVQQQLRSESSGGAYADLKANFYQQLQQIYGQPGSGTSLDSAFNNFTTAVQALSTSPNSSAAQSQTIGAAQALAQQLNNATNSIQTLRSQADQGIAGDVQQANNALQQIANINQQLAGSGPADSTTALLENQRDQYIDQLSKLMDIRVVQGSNNQVSVFTDSGRPAGRHAGRSTQFRSHRHGRRRPSSGMPIRPKAGSERSRWCRPGAAAWISLPAAEYAPARSPAISTCATAFWSRRRAQLDEIAAQMSKALSDTTTAGTAVSGRLRCRHRQSVERKHHPDFLYRWIERPAQHHDCAGRRSVGAAVVEYGDLRPE